jgi:hypothetical protein
MFVIFGGANFLFVGTVSQFELLEVEIYVGSDLLKFYFITVAGTCSSYCV